MATQEKTNPTTASEAKMLTCLEFFSGIGGYNFAFQYLSKSIQILQSYDINDLANSAYFTTFDSQPSNRSIANLTLQQLEKYKADIWTLSPPCQPYTRGGKLEDELDQRTLPFINLLNILDKLICKPSYIVVENVLNFENSNTRLKMVETLNKLGYKINEFILNTCQFGFTNSRIRYYCLAERVGIDQVKPHNEVVRLDSLKTKWPLDEKLNPLVTSTCSCQLQNLDFFKLDTQDQFKNYNKVMEGMGCKKLSEILNFEVESRIKVEPKYIDRNPTFKLVTLNSLRTSCFTKAYGSKHIYTSGSLLKLSNSDNSLYYFNWEEVATLMGFPTPSNSSSNEDVANTDGRKVKFVLNFPDNFTERQKLQLLGNSFNPVVIAKLCERVFNW